MFTSAKILRIDIDRTFGSWLESLQELDESYPKRTEGRPHSHGGRWA